MRECQRDNGATGAPPCLKPRKRWPALALLLISAPAFAQAPLTAGGMSPGAGATLTGPGGLLQRFSDAIDEGPANKPSDREVAEVDGRVITLADVHDLIATLPPEMAQQDLATLYPRVLEQLIYRTALALEARREGLDKDALLRRRFEGSTDQILANAWLHKHLDNAISEKLLLERYQRDIGSQPPPEEVRLQLYLADTELQAKQAIAEIRGGADFAGLARSGSKNPSAANGGDLGFLPWTAVIPEIAGIAQGLENGELAPVPVRTRFGWVVVRLESRRLGTRPSFAEMRNRLLEQMVQERARPMAEHAVKSMIVRTFALNGVEDPNPNNPTSQPRANR